MFQNLKKKIRRKDDEYVQDADIQDEDPIFPRNKSTIYVSKDKKPRKR
jgi:hypothetical protein